MLIEIDQNFSVTDFDESMLSFLNLQRERLLDTDFCSLWHKDVPEVVIKDFRKSVKKRINYASVIKLSIDDKEVWLSFRTSPHSSRNGRTSTTILRIFNVEEQIINCTQKVFEEML